MTKRTCSRCDEAKPPAEFYFKVGKLLRSECKACFRALMRPRSRAHYRANTKYYRKRNAVRRKQLYDFIRAAKTDKRCLDCRKPHPYWRLDFDHRNGATKDRMLSRVATRGWSIARVEREMAKCDLVCANCHRDRTFRRLRGRKDLNPRL